MDAEFAEADDFLEEFVFGAVDHALGLGHFEEFAEFFGGEGVLRGVAGPETRRWMGRRKRAWMSLFTGKGDEREWRRGVR